MITDRDIEKLKQAFANKEDHNNQMQKLDEIKVKIDDLYSFSVLAFGNLFDWVEDIHKTIVKKELPKRVKRLEKYLKS